MKVIRVFFVCGKLFNFKNIIKGEVENELFIISCWIYATN